MTDREPLAPPVIEAPAAEPPPRRRRRAARPSRGAAWWARNRWGLLALPLALALALGAASDRLSEYWWGEDLRVQDDRAAAGETATLTGAPASVERGDDGLPIDGAEEPSPVSVDIALERIDRLSVLDDGYSTEPLPDGADAYRVRLALTSEAPIEPTCILMLVGDDGARYGDGRDPLLQYDACAERDPDGATVTGPTGSWTNEYTILTASGAELDHARVTFDGVHYVRLDLP